MHGNSVVDTHATLLTAYEEKDMESFFDEQFSLEYIQEALGLLDPEDQEIFHARYILQYPYDVIADLYNLNADTIRQKISRILKKTRKNLQFLKK